MSFAHNQKLPWTDANRQELRKLWPTHSAAHHQSDRKFISKRAKARNRRAK